VQPPLVLMIVKYLLCSIVAGAAAAAAVSYSSRKKKGNLVLIHDSLMSSRPDDIEEQLRQFSTGTYCRASTCTGTDATVGTVHGGGRPVLEYRYHSSESRSILL
jgi:hypothetical protein